MSIITTTDYIRADSTKRTEWRAAISLQVYAYLEAKVRTYTWDCDNGEEPALQNPDNLQSADGWNCAYRGCQIQRGEPTGIYTETWEQTVAPTFL